MNYVAIEEQIVASVLTWGARALAAVPNLSTHDFEDPVLREIFATCLRVHDDGLAIDQTTVGAVLFGNHAAIERFSALFEGIHPDLLPAYLRTRRTARAVKDAVRLARQIVAFGDSDQPDEARLSAMREIAQKIVEGSTSPGDPLVPFQGIAKAETELLDEIRAGKRAPERLETGIRDLDSMLYIEPGDLVVIGGDTSSGKSAFCGQLAAHYAKCGKPVAFVTSEMTHRQMLARIVSGLTGVPVATLVNPRTAADANADEHYRRFAGLPIFFQRKFPPRVEDAVVAIRAAVARHKVHLAVIDYAQRLAELDDEHQEHAIAKVAHESKNLAMERGIVVVAAAQLNRQITYRKDPRPVLADLRGSGRLEQDANTVLFTYQPSRYGRSGAPELIVAKQRNGKVGSVKVSFIAETCLFRDLEGGRD